MKKQWKKAVAATCIGTMLASNMMVYAADTTGNNVSVITAEVEGEGTQSSPYSLTGNCSQTIGTGATVYYSVDLSALGGKTVKVSNESMAEFTLQMDTQAVESVDGVAEVTLPEYSKVQQTASVSITNKSNKVAIDCSIAIVDAAEGESDGEGTESNPKVVEAGSHEVTSSAGVFGYYLQYTAPAAGKATVGISAESGTDWAYSVNVGNKYGDLHFSDGYGEGGQPVPSEVHEVNAGDVLLIQAGACDLDSGEFTEGVVTITITFVEDSVDEEVVTSFAYDDVEFKDEITTEDGEEILTRVYTDLKVGTNELTDTKGATDDYSLGSMKKAVYRFKPEAAGIYTFTTTSEGVKLYSLFGGSSGVITGINEDNTDRENNVVTLTVEEEKVNSTYWIGVIGAESYTVEISKADLSGGSEETMEWTVCEPSISLESYTHDASKTYTIFDKASGYPLYLDQNGYYHVYSVDGPLVLANIGYDGDPSLLTAAGYGHLRYPVYNENNEIIQKLDYSDCITKYYAKSDNGLYPLTEDLEKIYKEFGAAQGWYGANGWVGEGESAWLAACTYEVSTVLAQDQSITIPAGSEYSYYGRIAGNVLTVKGDGAYVILDEVRYDAVDGVVKVSVPASSLGVGNQPVYYRIGNSSNAEMTYDVTIAVPTGTVDNPEVVELGTVEMEFEKDTEGYYYTYTAESTGTLVVSVAGDTGCQYYIHNLTANKYGDTWVVASGTIGESCNVTAGDELVIWISTFDANNAFSAPAGKVTLSMSICTEHTYETSVKKATLTTDGSTTTFCTNCHTVSNTSVVYAAKNIGLSWTKATYTGKTIAKPALVVKDSQGNVIDASNYDVTGLVDAKAVGTYNVTITFKGNYEGTKTLTYVVQPKAVSNVKATLYGYDDVKVSWSKATGATSYKVYYKKASASKWSSKTTTKTYLKLSNLSDGVKYSFKVVPCYEAGESTNTKTVSVTTLKKVTFSAVKKASSSKVKLTWKNIDGETGYQISCATTKKGTKIVKTVKGASLKTYKLSAKKGKTCYYKVRAYKTVDGKKVYGPWSSVIKFKLK